MKPKILLQENMRNWRRLTLSETGIKFELETKDIKKSLTFSFTETGPLKEDYEELVFLEQQGNPQYRLLILVLLIVISLCSMVFASMLNSTNESGSALLITCSLAVLLGVGAYNRYMTRRTRVNCRKIFFTGGQFLTVYYRTQQEKDQVNAFINTIDQAQTAFSKKQFITVFEGTNNKATLKNWFGVLNQKGAFEEEEFEHYNHLISKAKKKTSKIPDNTDDSKKPYETS